MGHIFFPDVSDCTANMLRFPECIMKHTERSVTVPVISRYVKAIQQLPFAFQNICSAFRKLMESLITSVVSFWISCPCLLPLPLTKYGFVEDYVAWQMAHTKKKEEFQTPLRKFPFLSAQTNNNKSAKISTKVIPSIQVHPSFQADFYISVQNTVVVGTLTIINDFGLYTQNYICRCLTWWSG